MEIFIVDPRLTVAGETLGCRGFGPPQIEYCSTLTPRGPELMRLGSTRTEPYGW